MGDMADALTEDYGPEEELCEHPFPEGHPDFLRCPDCGKRLVWNGVKRV